MNRLSEQTSPYLRQHQDNPVDWFAWTPQAFAEAQERDVPILLSIGYSACHWCHVMAHECFENSQVAAQMNKLFVNIKVDREERPDVDAIYMDAVQALTGSGGWPLTVFLTPDAEPFFGGTYFPPRNFIELMNRVDEAWHNNRDALLGQATELTAMLKKTSEHKPDKSLPNPSVLTTGAAQLASKHDAQRGGFGGAPKFPQAMNIDALLRHYRRGTDQQSLDIATHSLKAMICGGIYDHIGGGFARYSVDVNWDIPHFEKMLYDQALIGSALLHGWQLTKDADLEQALSETIGYVLTNLTSEDGGFYSAEDADADSTEGSFTVFTPDEISQILGPEDGELFCEWYQITETGNFEGSSNPRRPLGASIVRDSYMSALRDRVFVARSQRVKPGLDDKVLLEWNGLMLVTLAQAAAATGKQTWLEAAKRNAEFLLDNLRDKDGSWFRAWASGKAQHSPIAADLAAITDAFTRLYEATGEKRWLDEAKAVADRLLSEHEDERLGGFFTTGASAERLIARSKDLMDSATPGGNSLAAVALLRLAALTASSTYQNAGLGAIRLVTTAIEQHPTAFGHMLQGVALAHKPPGELVITGDRPDLVTAVQAMFHPDMVLSWGERIADSALWDDRDDGLAFVCRNHVCSLPVSSLEELTEQLR